MKKAGVRAAPAVYFLGPLWEGAPAAAGGGESLAIGRSLPPFILLLWGRP